MAGVPENLRQPVVFVALAALALLVLSALEVSSLLKTSLETEARDGAMQDAQLITDQGLAAAVADGRLTNADRRAAGAEFAAARRSHPLVGLAVWNERGRAVVTAGRGGHPAPPPLVHEALARHSAQSAAGTDAQAGETFEVAVPLRAAGQRYVAQFTFSADRVERIIAAAHHRLYALVAIVGVLFYAAALPLLVRLARRLPSPIDPARRHVLSDLRRALENDELRVHYQPKVDVGTGTAVGVEALARWEHPTRGLLGPGEFIAAAESDVRVLSRLTGQILDRAVSDCAAWRRAGRELPVAVNVSSQMVFDGPLAETVRAALERHGVEPRMLTLEVTESALMERGADAVATLCELRTLGVRVSIDDFGTGYSSLARLRTLPLDELKVDRSFVNGIAGDKRDLALVRLMIDLASNVGLDVVAEGVENELSLSLLESIGCRVAQGFLFSQPLPEHELLERIDRPLRPDLTRAAP